MFKKSRTRLKNELRVSGWRGAQPKDTGLPPDALGDLQTRVRGTVVPASDPNYNQDRQLTNNAFQDFPQAIVYCEVFSDVRESLAFAQKYDLWITTRSGGHCTAGFSVNTGIVIDTSRLCYSVVDAHAMRAHVGAGTNFGYLNAQLDEYGLHTPGGGCEDVCVAGHMSGGGYGFTSREFGLNCDNVLEVTMMLGDGRIVRADRKRNADLYWASRGGTGNNFGVILQLTYQLHELRDVWGYGLRWPLEDAPRALVELQKNYTKTGAPKELGYMGVVAHQGGAPYLLMRGMFDGKTEDGKRALRSLLKTKGCELQIDKRGSYYHLNQDLLEKPNPIPECPDLAREEKRSAIMERELNLKEWQRIIAKYRETPNTWSTIVLEPYGGHVAAIPLDDNAFIHRDASLDLFCDVFWMDAKQETEAKQFLDDFLTVVDPMSNGHQYQNYPRLGTKDYAWAYWGDAYPRLREVKSKYDPGNLFYFAQSIKPADKAAGRVGRASEIEYEHTRANDGSARPARNAAPAITTPTTAPAPTASSSTPVKAGKAAKAVTPAPPKPAKKATRRGSK